ncbi:multicopper oxidase domain-containing protein [Gandjariella thermophila]|nr:multicopper oxidase domain-containing protein [Gandjariella thermophila]
MFRRGDPRTPRLIALGMAFVFATAGAGALAPAASAAVHTVPLSSLREHPGTLNVAVGDTVTWVNDLGDGSPQSVTGGVLNSPELPQGATYSYTFTGPGTYAYRSRFAQDLLGQVVVAGANPATGVLPPNILSPPNLPGVGGIAPVAGGDGQARDLGDGTQLAPYRVVDGVKVFTLDAAPMNLEVSPGKVRQAYAFNGLVPGPVIRVNEGDRIRVVVRNHLPEPTSVHWHGMQLPNDQDGVPDLTQQAIEPGQTYTYEFTAVSPGTHWYHSHMDGDQEGRGLYGALEVVPRGGDIPADRDYRLMIGDGPLGFVFNGKSFPSTTQLVARVGERVHIRLIGTGPEMIHPIHVHGGYFTVVAQDGRPLKVPQEMDTVNVGVGQTYDIIFVPQNPGKWMIHCHIFSHSESAQGMTGLVTILQVDPAAVPVPTLPSLPPILPGTTGQG